MPGPDGHRGERELHERRRVPLGHGMQRVGRRDHGSVPGLRRGRLPVRSRVLPGRAFGHPHQRLQRRRVRAAGQHRRRGDDVRVDRAPERVVRRVRALRRGAGGEPGLDAAHRQRVQVPLPVARLSRPGPRQRDALHDPVHRRRSHEPAELLVPGGGRPVERLRGRRRGLPDCQHATDRVLGLQRRRHRRRHTPAEPGAHRSARDAAARGRLLRPSRRNAGRPALPPRPPGGRLRRAGVQRRRGPGLVRFRATTTGAARWPRPQRPRRPSRAATTRRT